MALASMTGFARAQGQSGRCAWIWEVRSVNGRGLDVRCRLPAGFEGLEAAVRERAATRFTRGNLSLSLNVTWSRAEAGYRINTDMLERLLALWPELKAREPALAPPRFDGLLGLKGVIEPADDSLDEAARESLEKAILGSLDVALAALGGNRLEEGARLAGILGGQLDEIDGFVAEAEALVGVQAETIRERLKNQVERLLKDVPQLSEERLMQEAALLMTKADIREELDRLAAHVSAARGLLAEDGAVGRRLDFLCQELNREANTLCAKASDTDISRAGLEIRAVVDRLREQVQNIE